MNNARENKSDVFNWNIYTKQELIHILIMHENIKGRKDLFETLNELQYGVDICKYCKSMYGKDYVKDLHNGALMFDIQNTSKYKKAKVQVILTFSDDYTIHIYDDTYELLETKKTIYATELSSTLESMWETQELKKKWDQHKKYEMKFG